MAAASALGLCHWRCHYYYYYSSSSAAAPFSSARCYGSCSTFTHTHIHTCTRVRLGLGLNQQLLPVLHGLSSSSTIMGEQMRLIYCEAAIGDQVSDENEESAGAAGDGDETVKELGLASELQLLRKKAKKERKRRWRLLQKRKMRKKGRWPPAKMAKNRKI